MSICINRSNSNSLNRMLNDFEMTINESSIDELDFYNSPFGSRLEEEVYRKRLEEVYRKRLGVQSEKITTSFQYIEEYKDDYDFNIVELEDDMHNNNNNNNNNNNWNYKNDNNNNNNINNNNDINNNSEEDIFQIEI